MTPRRVRVEFRNAGEAEHQLGVLTARIEMTVECIDQFIRTYPGNQELIDALLDMRLVLLAPQEQLID